LDFVQKQPLEQGQFMNASTKLITIEFKRNVSFPKPAVHTIGPFFKQVPVQSTEEELRAELLRHVSLKRGEELVINMSPEPPKPSPALVEMAA